MAIQRGCNFVPDVFFYPCRQILSTSFGNAALLKCTFDPSEKTRKPEFRLFVVQH